MNTYIAKAFAAYHFYDEDNNLVAVDVLHKPYYTIEAESEEAALAAHPEEWCIESSRGSYGIELTEYGLEHNVIPTYDEMNENYERVEVIEELYDIEEYC